MSVPRVLLTWLLLAVLMSGNGVLREMLIRPLLGEREADALSALLGATIILLVTRLAFRSASVITIRRLAAMSVLLVVMTVAFEFAVGLWVDQRPVRALLANYAFWRGELWPWLLALIAATPFLWARPEPRGSGDAD